MAKKLMEDIFMSFPVGQDIVRSFSKKIYKDRINIIPEIIIPTINYGYLYNWYAVSDIRNIAPVGWHIPSTTEWSALATYISSDANKLKETGSERWFPSVNNSTNDYLFDGRPGGYRSNYGWFADINTRANFWSVTNLGGGSGDAFILDNTTLSHGARIYSEGFSIRCVRDTGNTETTAIDYDGNIYESTDINGQVWLRRNLVTTHYRNGESIPKVTSNSSWSNLLTSGYCAYNNLETNAFN